MRPSERGGEAASQPRWVVSWRRSLPFSSMDHRFIVPSRSERKYTRPFHTIGDLEVPKKSAVRGTASELTLKAIEALEALAPPKPSLKRQRLWALPPW